jgi:ribosome biogenesis GTPase
VDCDGQVLECHVPYSVGEQPVVGDVVSVASAGSGSNVMREIMPRRTVLTRADPGRLHGQKVIAANVDVAVIVVSVKAPPLHVRLIDRWMVTAQTGRIEPIVCVNKIDLLEPDALRAELSALQPYVEVGVPVIECSASNGTGIDDLVSALSGRMCVFVGHSGVGKSSILNALDPSLGLLTNSLRQADGKGRHTTTASTLYRLAHGITVIDTPGIRELGLAKVGRDELKWHFPEFAEFGCRFNDCSHSNEPGCGVRLAVRDGLVSRARYESYCKLLGLSPAPVETVGGSFACANCGERVPAEVDGTQHRNHCPKCLWSVHLDHRPGDRAACCGGPMEPVAVWVRKGDEWAIIHRCRECGEFSSNRIAGDDNEMLLLSLAARPLARPPFPIERV